MSNELARISSSELAQGTTFDTRQIDLIRSQIADGATDDELMLFIQVASSRGLDPFRKHIYAVKRYDSKKKREVLAYQVSIDGLRLIAERSGKYEGQTAPEWCGPDKKWTDVWLDKNPPAAARVGVYIRGMREPLYAIALYSTFVQTTRDGEPTMFWKKMPEHMLAKCAESQALRKAFPEEAGGLYTAEEMGQSANVQPARSVNNVTQITGEIIEHEPQEAGTVESEPADDSLESTKRNLWKLVHGQHDWSLETLNDVSLYLMTVRLDDLTPSGMSELWAKVSAYSAEQLDAVGQGASFESTLV